MVSVVDQRVLVRTQATLGFQALDQFGEDAAPSGAVTLDVARSDGTALVTAAATSGSGDDPRTYDLALSANTLVDLLACTWKVGADTIGTTKAAVVGRPYISTSRMRAIDSALVNETTYPTSMLLAARTVVETMFEDICGVAFVPRFEVERFIGSGSSSHVLDWGMLRSVRWCRTYIDPDTPDAFSAEYVSALSVNDESGVLQRLDGQVWTKGILYEVGYEHGYDRLPPDLESQVVKAIRAETQGFKGELPDRATAWQPIEGGMVNLATPGLGRWKVGIPSVDEALRRYTVRGPQIGRT